MSFKTLTASHKAQPPVGKKIRPVSPNKRLTVALQMPTAASQATIDRLLSEVESGARAPLTAKELEKVLGSNPSHTAQITRKAKAHGLTILPRSQADKSHGIVRVKGTYSRFQIFFPELKLHVYKEHGEEIVGREGSINVLESLPVVGVFGFDERDVAHHNHQILPAGARGRGRGKVAGTGLTSRGIARLQGVPVDDLLTQVTGLVTGYISLGGDNGKRMQKDQALAAKYDGVPVAKVIGVSIGGAKIEGDYNDGATVENRLDMDAHGLLNPNGYVVVFRADNTDDAFALAQETANVSPGVKVGNKTLPLVGVSDSWGQAATQWAQQSLQRWLRAFQAARLRGIIVTSATGDNGSKDNTDSDTPDAPSCVPNGFGAGGVFIESTDGKTVSAIGVWNDGEGGGATGGGIGDFPVQPEEVGLNLPVSNSTKKAGHSASTFADVAAPASGPLVFYKGRSSQVGGTSHASPFMDIKMALVQALLINRIPDMLGFCYKHAAEGIFHQVTEAGNNGGYTASPTNLANVPVGFGVMNWTKFLQVAKKVQDGVGA